MLEVHRLYPQYIVMSERRNQVAPVAFERRSGIDRRTEDRVQLDTRLTKDIFEVKSKVAEAQKTVAEKIPFSQNISKAIQNAKISDQFIKTQNPNMINSPKIVAKEKSDAGAVAGILSAVLGGTLASAFLGAAGIGIAVGLGAYFGGKALRSAIVTHLKNK